MAIEGIRYRKLLQEVVEGDCRKVVEDELVLDECGSSRRKPRDLC